MRLIALSIAALSAAIIAGGCGVTIEEAKYKVVSKDRNYEIREYARQLTGDLSNPMEIYSRIRQNFTSRFVYTLDPPSDFISPRTGDYTNYYVRITDYLGQGSASGVSWWSPAATPASICIWRSVRSKKIRC